MTRNKIKCLPLAISLLSSNIFITACSKEGNDNEQAGCLFSPTDFSAKSTGAIIEDLTYEAEFEISNKKNLPYNRSEPKNCYYAIEAKMKATDGSEYVGDAGLPDMTANGAGVAHVYINHPRGKVMNPETLSFVIKGSDKD